MSAEKKETKAEKAAKPKVAKKTANKDKKKQPKDTFDKCLAIITLKKFRKPKAIIPVLRFSGVISSGGGGMRSGISLEELEDDIKKAFERPHAKAVAIQVNSPGGSPVQSEFIYRRVRQYSQEKEIPVFTFAEDVAASGGYWLACIGDEIYASESSLIGSIGVISSGFGFKGAIQKMGVERRVYAQGENKSILDPFVDEKESDIAILTNAQKDVHDSFKALVKNRRKGKIKVSEEKRLFSGEFWSGKQAKALGLIDEIGEMREVMRKKYGKKVKFEKIQRPKGWLRRKLPFGSQVTLADAVVEVLENKAMWSRYGF